MAVDDKILAMLAILEDDKASEGEKENATRLIQVLATKHSLDLERLRFAKDHRSKAAAPIARDVIVSPDLSWGPHKNRFWVDLMLAIGRQNDLKMTISHTRSRVTCYGYETDVEFAEMLFKSLATQMVMSCNEALRRGDHTLIGVHGRTFRPNFYEGFINKIGSRLRESRMEALETARKQDEEIASRLSAVIPAGEQIVTDGGDSPRQEAGTDVVLASKREKVDEFYDTKTRGRLGRGSYNSYGAGNRHYGAQNAGTAAGARASLGATSALGGSKRAIR